MKGGRTLLLLAGPTGGHLFPAFATAEACRQKFPGWRIHLLTGRRAENRTRGWKGEIFDEVHYLGDFPFSKQPRMWGSFFIRLLGAFWRSYQLLRKLRPSVCIGFGSYVAFPGIVLARLLGIPTLIHEQNRVPGKATAQLIRFANRVALSFDPAAPFEMNGKFVKTGYPIRRVLVEAAECQRVGRGGRFTLLVLGGSQGAARLNSLILSALSQFRDEEKNNFAVIHITGEKDWHQVNRQYENMGVEFEVYPYVEKMEEIFPRVDAAVTRAGAGTIFELALFGIPTIMIPYPHAGDHQLDNARFLALQDACDYREESAVDASWLLGQIRHIRNNQELRDLRSGRISCINSKNASFLVLEQAEAVLGGGK